MLRIRVPQLSSAWLNIHTTGRLESDEGCDELDMERIHVLSNVFQTWFQKPVEVHGNEATFLKWGVKTGILIVHCSTHNKRENHKKPQAKQFEHGTIGQDMRRLSQSLAGFEVEREIRNFRNVGVV